MKKIIIAFVLCIVSTIVFGQDTKIGSYHCDYFDKDFDVYYSPSTGYMIQISAEREGTNMFVVIDKNKIDRFRYALSQVITKYDVWTDVAKENNVDDFDKNMGIFFPSVDIAWITSNTWIALGIKPEPRFLVKNDKYLCILLSGKTVTAFENKYVDNKAYWVFSTIEEIKELDMLLSPGTLNKIKETKSKTDDLFH